MLFILLLALTVHTTEASWQSAYQTTVAAGLLSQYAIAGPSQACATNASQVQPPFQQPADWRLPLFDALIVYPCDLAQLGGRVPALAFGIGYQGWPRRYIDTLSHVASHGFVVIAPKTMDRNPLPLDLWQHEQAMVLALAWLSTSYTFGSFIDSSRSGTFGHSMGAGDATVAAALMSNSSFARLAAPTKTMNLTATLLTNLTTLPDVVAYFTMGFPPEDFPVLPDIASLNATSVRGFWLAGTQDTYAPPKWEVFAFGKTAGPRMMAMLQGGTHCYMDAAHWAEYPVSGCVAALTNPGTLMSPSAQLWVARALLALHFRAVLKDDSFAAKTLALLASSPQALAAGAPIVTQMLSVAQPGPYPPPPPPPSPSSTLLSSIASPTVKALAGNAATAGQRLSDRLLAASNTTPGNAIAAIGAALLATSATITQLLSQAASALQYTAVVTLDGSSVQALLLQLVQLLSGGGFDWTAARASIARLTSTFATARKQRSAGSASAAFTSSPPPPRARRHGR